MSKKEQFRQALKDWATKNKLTYYQALSIALVPLRSISDLVKGEKRILGIRYRLHMLTDLDLYKLSVKDLAAYEQHKADNLFVRQQEEIARFFISKWKNEGEIIEERDQLVLRAKYNRQMSKHLQYLVQKYLLNSPVEKTFTEDDIEPATESWESFLSLLIRILKSDITIINQFRSLNKDHFLKIQEGLYLLGTDDPKAALAKLEDTHILFKTLKTFDNEEEK